jgi:putative peptide zinc metalloprotease protein
VISPADRPVRAAGVTLRRRPDDGVVLLERRGRYHQISGAAAAIWHWCDGEHDVVEIAQRYHERHGIDGSAAIAALLERWYAAGLVAAHPPGIADALGARDSISLTRRGASMYIAWPLERWAGRVRSIADRAFAPPVLAALTAIALAGGALALHMGNRPTVSGTAQVLAVIVHEAGHALTLARFGGTVRRAGIGWYWCAPVAFVDTSDAHALPRAQRIGVSLGGPIASFALAGLATIVASCALPDGVRSVAWSLAIVNYSVSLWNLNPLIELDGYYILTDVLNRPNLRSDAFSAFRRGRPSRIEFAYVAGALAYALVMTALVLQTIIPRITIAIRALHVM